MKFTVESLQKMDCQVCWKTFNDGEIMIECRQCKFTYCQACAGRCGQIIESEGRLVIALSCGQCRDWVELHVVYGVDDILEEEEKEEEDDLNYGDEAWRVWEEDIMREWRDRAERLKENIKNLKS